MLSLMLLCSIFGVTGALLVEDTTEDTEEAGKYLLISSSGPAADSHSGKVAAGLYHLSEEMREGRSVYIQEHDTKYGYNPHKLFSDQGVWMVTNDGDVRLRSATSSRSPTSVNWQYYDYDKNTWHNDPALTVTSLSEKPRKCEVRISLSEDITLDIEKPGVAGVYKADGTYN